MFIIKKVFFTAVATLFLYSGFVYFVGPKWQSSQDQYQDNLIKAQSFLYDFNDSTKNIIVGSSLSCRLVMDSIPEFYNLSFHGLSVSEGLNILMHSKASCNCVYVEMNVASKSENKGFTSSLNSTFLFYPRKIFPVLREGKQPIGVVGTFLAYHVFWKLRTYFSKPISTFEPKPNADYFSILLNQTISGFSETPDEKLLKKSFENIKLYINLLENQGVKFVFFEMPVNKSVCELNYPKKIRETFYKYFPKDKYLYLPSPNCSAYNTTDGIHLGNDEALRFTLSFRKLVEVYCK
jgi:hypothetical protein